MLISIQCEGRGGQNFKIYCQYTFPYDIPNLLLVLSSKVLFFQSNYLRLLETSPFMLKVKREGVKRNSGKALMQTLQNSAPEALRRVELRRISQS